jgi:phosphoribosylglycinamide formyltransferase-1
MALKLGILLSGDGEDLRALQSAVEAGALDAEIVLVVSSTPDASGLKYADEHGLRTMSLSDEVYADPDVADMVIASQMSAASAEWLAMSGYDREVFMPLITMYEDRILDIHPSLLPAFPDEGAVYEAYSAGVKVTGATVVIVNEMYPAPPIVSQEALRIGDGWSLDDLAREMRALEDRLYVDAIEAVSEGRLVLLGNRHVEIRPRGV